jgi:esterase/lipase/1-acyl-sn-glycerol-3-phosphate acyltransferase
MNPFAYRTTSLAIKTLYSLSKADLATHGLENIPQNASIIFVINHFTRIETLLMPVLISRLTGRPVWSLADDSLFVGPLRDFLDSVGAVSTKDPLRDQLIVKTLLTGEAHWIIFPEGRMVKSQKIVEKGRYIVSYAGGKHPPHTGAATLALRTEFYRQRLLHLKERGGEEAKRLLEQFHIGSMDEVASGPTCIVPVNITYFPLRARENILSKLAVTLVGKDLPERVLEEIMTEGAMLLSGVDIDIRFAPPIELGPYLQSARVQADIRTPDAFGLDAPAGSGRRLRRVALRVMTRYMDHVYRMTTVNSDHLFAAMLRQLPYRRTSAMDLRRRVYLVTSDPSNRNAIHWHHQLGEDQLHLITDDRFHRFHDFKTVAMEKGVLEERGGHLVRVVSKLSPPLDFHRIRIENPVAVMANAIEPLKQLQRQIRRIAWLPAYLVRHRIAKALMEGEREAFEADYADFFREGESKPKEIGRPVFHRGRGGGVGVLLIHGYLAAPAEVAGLARHLSAKGYAVYAPRLKGHGTSPEDLAQRHHEEWVRSVDIGYAILQNLCRRVVVGGFSTGGGLALDLAARMGDIHGVFAICPPLRLHDLSSKLVPAVDAWNRLTKKFQFEGVQKEFLASASENPLINYPRNPVSGVRELERLMHALVPKLRRIKVPTLILQASKDPMVAPRGAREAFDLLGAEHKVYSLLNFSRHSILMGEGADRVHRLISDFIRDL